MTNLVAELHVAVVLVQIGLLGSTRSCGGSGSNCCSLRRAACAYKLAACRCGKGSALLCAHNL